MAYIWILTVFNRATENYSGELKLGNLGIEEAREILGGTEDDDPMLDVYPIATPELYSWAGKKVDAELDPATFEYFAEQRLE